MLSGNQRFVSLIVIWISFTIIASQVLNGNMDRITTFLTVAVAASVVLLSTWFLIYTSTDAVEESQKSKRRTRVDRFMDDLSDSEVDELRARLSADTDEQPVSIEEVLSARRRS